MLGERIEHWLSRYREHRRRSQPGALGAFFRAGGDELLHTDLALGHDAVALDLGGYHGDWAAEILVRYGARVVVIEAMPDAADRLRARFEHNALVRVIGKAVMPEGGRVSLSDAANSSSIVPLAGAGRITVDAIALSAVLDSIEGEIGVVKMNIEGAEFDLLDEWHRLGQMARVRTWLIQFHDTIADAPRRMARAEELLRATHAPTFQHSFVWERWDRRAR